MSSSILSVRGGFFSLACAIKIISPGGQRVGYKRLRVPRLGAGQLWHRPTAFAASPKIPQHPGGLGEQGVEVDVKVTSCFAGSNKPSVSEPRGLCLLPASLGTVPR